MGAAAQTHRKSKEPTAMAADDKPSQRQLRYLRQLAEQTGTSFSLPTTRAQASRDIERLKQRPRSTTAERYGERKSVILDLDEQQPASTVRDDEITGYGSNATWR
jgi:hypothetical protein